MKYIVFNTLLFLMLLIFLDSKELKEYISDCEKQYLFIYNIIFSNLLYFLDIYSIYIFMIAIVSISGYIDYRYKEIPNNATWISLFLCVPDLINSGIKPDFVFGLLLYVVFFIFCLLGFIGGGDLKLFLPINLLLGGISFLIFNIIISFFIAIFNIRKLITHKNDSIALAPYFYISLVSMVFLTNF